MKKQERLANKKRKAVAHFKMIEINENDKMEKSRKADPVEETSENEKKIGIQSVVSSEFVANRQFF